MEGKLIIFSMAIPAMKWSDIAALIQFFTLLSSSIFIVLDMRTDFQWLWKCVGGAIE